MKKSKVSDAAWFHKCARGKVFVTAVLDCDAEVFMVSKAYVAGPFDSYDLASEALSDAEAESAAEPAPAPAPVLPTLAAAPYVPTADELKERDAARKALVAPDAGRERLRELQPEVAEMLGEVVPERVPPVKKRFWTFGKNGSYAAMQLSQQAVDLVLEQGFTVAGGFATLAEAVDVREKMTLEDSQLTRRGSIFDAPSTCACAEAQTVRVTVDVDGSPGWVEIKGVDLTPGMGEEIGHALAERLSALLRPRQPEPALPDPALPDPALPDATQPDPVAYHVCYRHNGDGPHVEVLDTLSLHECLGREAAGARVYGPFSEEGTHEFMTGLRHALSMKRLSESRGGE